MALGVEWPLRKSPQVRAIVFDWDLTLWNSWDIHLAAVAHVAERLDLPLPPKEEIAATYSSPFERYLEGLSASEPRRQYDAISISTTPTPINWVTFMKVSKGC